MRNVVKIICGVVIAALIGCSGYFMYQYFKVKGEKEVLIMQNAELQSTIDAIGPVTTAYTVSNDVKSGDTIGPDDFVEMVYPESCVTDTTILNTSSIEGKLYKVNLQPGTPVTSDMVMEDTYTDTVYEKDMVFEYLPLGLSIGDYIDIKISLPYGEPLVVMPHKRIEQIVYENNIIKTYMTPAQKALWESALRDKSLYRDAGLNLYVEKYVEPGVQNETLASYPVRQEIAAFVMIDRNIKNKKECINNTLRQSIDEILEMVDQNDKGKLSSGVSSEAGALSGAKSAYYEDDNKKKVANDTGEVDLENYDEYSDVREIDSSMESITESDSVTLE